MVEVLSYLDFKQLYKTDFSEAYTIMDDKNFTVVNMFLKSGSKFSVYPEKDITEFFYVVSGKFITEQGKEISSNVFIKALDHDNMSVLEDTQVLIISNSDITDKRDSWFNLHKLAEQLEEKDGATFNHCVRIRNYSLAIAKRLGVFTADEIVYLERAAYLHDIGKARIPQEILNKPGKLTPEEFEIMKTHAEFGKQMLLETQTPLLMGAAEIVGQHHERMDGNGYPKGLKGDEILLAAQIVGLADVYDALRTERVYKQALTIEETFCILYKEFPKYLVDTLSKIINLES